LGTGLALAAAGDTVTASAHGLTNGQSVRLSSIVSATGVNSTDPYFVVQPTTNTFKLALTNGGAPVDITADGTATVTVGGRGHHRRGGHPAAVGVRQRRHRRGRTATLLTGSAGKRRLTKAYSPAPRSGSRAAPSAV
jgi:hypothetical protein